MPTADEVMIDGRRITLWAPDAVPPSTPLLLCHDGQNVLAGLASMSGEGWHLDRAVMALERQAGLPAPVIVAPWNAGPDRVTEYTPMQARGDDYADWCAEVVVPWAVAQWDLTASRDAVAVMGSSMGGLASLHALARHPEAYGTALALSTHWTLGGTALVAALIGELPPPGSHRIWMDHGSRGLDAEYEPLQLDANGALDSRGWVEGRDYVYRAYPGADHNEPAWAARVADPLSFWLSGRGRLDR